MPSNCNNSSENISKYRLLFASGMHLCLDIMDADVEVHSEEDDFSNLTLGNLEVEGASVAPGS
jgi:hypothetical protein